jgi:hypothetical protein
MATLGMLVLFEAIAIPLLSPDMHLIAPWTLIRSVDSVTFQASVSLGALLVFTAIPLPYIVRATLLLCTGITMLVFGILHVQDASSAFAFRGHPGLAYVLTEQPAALAMTLGGLLFPTMLYWRSRYTASFSSRIAVLIGMLAMMACYFLVGAIGDLTSATPIVELARTVTNSDSLLANRLSAFALLVPLGVIPFATLIFLKHPRTGGAGFWAWLSVSSLAAVPLIQALFVSSWREGQWKYVLEPLQASLFLYAGLLLAPVALGHVIGEVERLIVLAKFKARHRRASAT